VSDQQLIERLQQEIAAGNQQLYVGAHLCKRVCSEVRHIARVPAGTNVKFHDSCTAMWVVNGTLVNFCACVESDKKCLSVNQGSTINTAIFANALHHVISNTSNVSL